MNTQEIAQQAQQQAQAVFRKLPLLGPVAWLMMQQGASRHAFISDLEWRIMPPLLLDQAKLYMKGDAPLAFVSWARLSDAAITRYRTVPHHLAPSDWNSGDKVWIVDLFAPFGDTDKVFKDVRENIFPSSTLYQLAPMPDGVISVQEWPPIGTRH